MHAAGASLGVGCNIIVPQGAKLILGKSCAIGRFVEIGPGPLIEIGDRTTVQDRCIILGRVKFGRYCVLSYDIYISSGQHIFDRKPYALIRDQDREFGAVTDTSSQDASQIIIEDDVWIGVHAVLMPGISIGRGCVIGANSVVTRSLPPYSVAAGAPARIIRKRFEFAPPAAIDWQREEDIPYFYRGFETSADERRRHADLGGHVAADAFAVWLKPGLDGKICVRAQSVPGSETVLHRGGRSERLSQTAQTYEFDDDIGGEARAEPSIFSVTGGPVVVSSACTR